MAKKMGLPETVRMRHDFHLVDEIAQRTRSPIIRNIPVEKVFPNELQPRKEIGDLGDMVESIKAKGIIEPIIVRPRDGNFEIIAGERRFRAAMQSGLNEVPCIELDIPDNEALEISIIENLQRKDLNVFEEANALKLLADVYGFTHQEIAQRIGKSRVTVSELVRICDLPKSIVARCLELKINSKTFILELVKIESPEQMNAMLDQYHEQAFSRDEIKKARKEKDSSTEKTAIPKRYHFKFSSDDHSFRLNLTMQEKPSGDMIIDILNKLIDDIKGNRIKDFLI